MLSPQPSQNVMPVMPTVSVKHSSGSTRGLGPLLFVSRGEGRLPHDCRGPQPKFRPPMGMWFTSSLQPGPFSVSQSSSVTGSKANPNELRIP